MAFFYKIGPCNPQLVFLYKTLVSTLGNAPLQRRHRFRLRQHPGAADRRRTLRRRTRRRTFRRFSGQLRRCHQGPETYFLGLVGMGVGVL